MITLDQGGPDGGNQLILLIAPNVSEQMGGEAIKALQIFREFKKLNNSTIQITHERCESELSVRLGLKDIYYVRDTWVSKLLWHSILLRKCLDVWFSAKAVRLAERMAEERHRADRSTVIHQTEPNSPVVLRTASRVCYNVFGPINGNIYYPLMFQDNETILNRVRRRFHMPLQRLSGLIFAQYKKVDVVLAAGGDRTIASLLMAACPRGVIKPTVDSGVSDSIFDRPRIKHLRENFVFVHYGRLVYHKGTFLAIEALKQSDDRIKLEIIGDGPELVACKGLVRELGLEARVRFLSWFESHQELLGSLNKYRGVILPSFEDANGIVVQEALAIGLPPICLDWGGPKLLIESGKSGFLIDVGSKERMVGDIARALERLSREPELAEQMSIAGRRSAETWRWSKVAKEWIATYRAHLG
jgi:glycosyltransferase involved in cell wall biosynthesis